MVDSICQRLALQNPHHYGIFIASQGEGNEKILFIFLFIYLLKSQILECMISPKSYIMDGVCEAEGFAEKEFLKSKSENTGKNKTENTIRRSETKIYFKKFLYPTPKDIDIKSEHLVSITYFQVINLFPYFLS